LPRNDVHGIEHLLEHEAVVLEARRLPWSRLQRILIAPRADDLLHYCRAVANVRQTGEEDVSYCYEKLGLPPAELNPPPLVTGHDLRQLGLPPGPQYRTLLTAIRDLQLDGELATGADALDWVRRQPCPPNDPRPSRGMTKGND
jgi:poly(A) polymerase